MQVVNVLGFSLPLYRSPTLLLSFGLSVRVLWHLLTRRPDVIHVSSPGILVFAAILYAKLLAIPLVVSYHTHIPEYIPKYTWKGLVHPMWGLIRFCTLMADLTLVPSKAMKVGCCVRCMHDTSSLCSNWRVSTFDGGSSGHMCSPADVHRPERSLSKVLSARACRVPFLASPAPSDCTAHQIVRDYFLVHKQRRSDLTYACHRRSSAATACEPSA